MNASGDPESPSKIIDYMQGFLVSETLFSASKLGVFDILLKSKMPLSCAHIAEQAGCSVSGMDKLLIACVGLKLLNVTQEDGKCLYSNTYLSQMYAAKSSPKSLYHMIQYMSDYNYPLSYYMEDSIREGKPQHEKIFKMNHEDTFTYKCLFRSEEETLIFMEFMNDIWKVCGKDMLTAFDLSHFKNICDVGGCTGAIAKIFISEYQKSKVTIFELPEIVKRAKAHFVSPAEKRISFCEGDFFKDALPEADLYIMARITHTWTDEQCLVILKNAYMSCKSGGAVLLIEVVLNEDKSGPIQGQMYSLLMNFVALGKERTPSEYRKLLTAAGFQDIDIWRNGNLFDVILGRKPIENEPC